MATVRECFDTESVGGMQIIMNSHMEADGTTIEPVFKLVYSFDLNAKYWFFYVPPCPDPIEIVGQILRMPLRDTQSFVRHAMPPMSGDIWLESNDGTESDSSADLVFTGRLSFYIDGVLTAAERAGIMEVAKSKGMIARLRDANYALKKNPAPVAFISHDSRDKDRFVRELARRLTQLQCPVWYDEFSLRVGDSLRESVEKGLKEAKACILVISQNYIANHGWTKAEFNAIFTRELVEKQNVILPVWLDVSHAEVYGYSPILADRFALLGSKGPDQVALELSVKLQRPQIFA